jgi:CheY-like chemotaxis protein
MPAMPAILVLEDDEDRSVAMKKVLIEQFNHFKHVFFDNAPETIAWLKENLEQVALICLDHDLGPNRQSGEDTFDPGTGRDVVDYLASQTPGCPVIIHTTNNWAAPGMQMALKEAGWKCSRVIPSADLKWIEIVWFRKLNKSIPTND